MRMIRCSILHGDGAGAGRHRISLQIVRSAQHENCKRMFRNGTRKSEGIIASARDFTQLINLTMCSTKGWLASPDIIGSLRRWPDGCLIAAHDFENPPGSDRPSSSSLHSSSRRQLLTRSRRNA